MYCAGREIELQWLMARVQASRARVPALYIYPLYVPIFTYMVSTYILPRYLGTDVPTYYVVVHTSVHN